MEQVPQISKPNYLVIGNGKLAKHLLFYFQKLNLSYSHWHRNSSLILKDIIKPRDIALLCLSDDALETFYQENLKEYRCVHFSGAKTIEGILGAHPLMMFGDDLLSLAEYKKIPFVVDNKEKFNEYFSSLENPFYEIAENDKAHYHALCVMAGNFTNFLWDEVKKSFQHDLALDPAVLNPYMNEVFKNIAKAEMSHTGPIVRGDIKTIESNLMALKNNHHKNIYQSFLQLKGMGPGEYQ